MAKIEKEAAKDEVKDIVDISVLFNEDTSDEAKASIKNIFETAVEARATELLRDEEAKRDELVAEQVAAAVSELEEKNDKFQAYVAEEWLKENELAMESSILVDRAHSLMEGLKTLFADHDIEVPDESEDVLEGLMARNEELVEKLNDAHKTIMALTEEAEQDELEVVLEELVKGLTTTQAEKLKTLAEGIRYKDAADFRKKLEDVKGAFFKDEKSVTTEAIDEGALDKEAPKSTVHADADAEAIVQAMKNKQR